MKLDTCPDEMGEVMRDATPCEQAEYDVIWRRIAQLRAEAAALDERHAAEDAQMWEQLKAALQDYACFGRAHPQVRFDRHQVFVFPTNTTKGST